jgi:hypothetical protein
MALLLWARFLLLALLVGVIASFVWIERSRERER